MAINDVVQRDLLVPTSMAADFTSPWQEVLYHNRGAIQAIWSGADATDAQVIPQASLDTVNWCDLATGASIEQISAAAGCLMYEFTDIGYSYWRIKFVANANTTGTIEVKTVIKRERGNGVP